MAIDEEEMAINDVETDQEMDVSSGLNCFDLVCFYVTDKDF